MAPHHRATPAQTYDSSLEKLEKYGNADRCSPCGRSRKRGCRGRLALGFKPRRSSHDKKNRAALALPLPHSLGNRKVTCSSDAELSLSSLEECRRATAGRKGVKGLLLVGHEKVPCDFGLRTRDPSDTADGAGNQERPVR